MESHPIFTVGKGKPFMDLLSKIKKTELAKLLKVASHYYTIGAPLIEDMWYDIMRDRLLELDPDYDTRSIDLQEPSENNKVKLPYWMGSMDKIKAEDTKELNRWLKENPGPYIYSDKLDGVSCLLITKRKKTLLYTRGKGDQGQDISHLTEYISLPNLRNAGNIAVRGELIMKKEKFTKYARLPGMDKRQGKSNARSMVAGLVNSKQENLDENEISDVDFVAYEYITDEPMKLSDQLKVLNDLGFDVVPYKKRSAVDMEIMEDFLEIRKNNSEYEIDGIIVTDNNPHERNTSGNPEYSFAFKGLTQAVDVVVTRVEWNPSKDGYLSPVVHFEQSLVSQAKLKQATGFNAKFIKDNKIGAGSVITIIRSGDVIPHIMAIKKPTRAEFPEDEEYHWNETKINIILDDIEGNSKVAEKRLMRLFTKMGIEDTGDALASMLVEKGVLNIFDLINLTEEDLLELDGFAERKARKIYKNIQIAAAKLDMITLMSASNVFGRGFAEKKLALILDVYPDIVEKYNTKQYEKWYVLLCDIKGVGPKSAEIFLDCLPEFKKLYSKVANVTEIKKHEAPVVTGTEFHGQQIVFTGFRNEGWKAIIELGGGKVTNTVTGKTTMLVYETRENTTKFKRAMQLGIPTLQKLEFAEQYNLE